MKNFLAFALKALISAALLYVAARSVHLESLQARLTSVDTVWMSAALLLLCVQVVLVALRWRRLAGLCGAPLSARDAIRISVIGMFFNQTLPSTIGGDTARVVMLGRASGNWKAATYSVLIDRGIGLVWLALVVLVCLPWSLQLIQNPVGRVTLALIGIGGLVGPVALYTATRLGRTFLQRWRITRHLTDAIALMWRALSSPDPSLLLGLFSISVHIITVLAAWMIARSIGAPLEFMQALMLVPPVLLISAIPISIAGWGVREGAMVAAFAYAGLPESDALATSLLFGAAFFLLGAVGGLVWFTQTKRN